MPAKNHKQRKNKGQALRPVPQTYQLVRPASRMTFGYHALGTLTEAAASTGAIYQFRLNSIYDPDYTGVGSTAQGYTAAASLYGTFRVMRVRVIARLALTTTGQAVVGWLAGTNPTVSSNYSYLEGQPNARSAFVQGNVGGAHAMKQWNEVVSLSKVAGITATQYSTDFDWSHLAGSNPSRAVYLTVFLAGNSAAIQTMIYNVRLVFDVEVSQPNQAVVS